MALNLAVLGVSLCGKARWSEKKKEGRKMIKRVLRLPSKRADAIRKQQINHSVC